MKFSLPKSAAAIASLLAGSLVALHAPTAKADLVINIFDTRTGDLKMTVKGKIDTLTTPLDPPYPPDLFSCGTDGLISTTALCSGPDQTENLLLYSASGSIDAIPLSIAGITPADEVDGQTFYLATTDNGFPENAFGLRDNYVAGDSYFSSATFYGQSLNSIGLAPGLVGVWSMDGTSEKVYLIAGPVPGPLPVLGAASAFGLSRRLRQRIRSRQIG